MTLPSYAHFAGIGGAGMMPLAALCAASGMKVTGSDLTESANTQILQTHFSIPIAIGSHRAENISSAPAPDLFIYTSALMPDNPELLRARELGCTCFKRGEALAHYAERYKRVVAVSGSHGKTSITAMIAHLLRQLDPEAAYAVGGKVRTWPIPARGGNGDIFATETDESDGSHTLIHAYLGVIPNVEDDHAWSLGGEARLVSNFKTFAHQCKRLLYLRSPRTDALFGNHPNAVALCLPSLEAADLFPTLPPHALDAWPDFQLSNAALSCKALEMLGFPRKEIEEALPSFPGVERRMIVHRKTPTSIIIEDYAHHPTELEQLLNSVRKQYANAAIQIVFQPHRYQRLKRYIDRFAALLKPLDKVYITPVFAAWVPAESITHADLADRIGAHAVAEPDSDWERIGHKIDFEGTEKRPQVTLIVGAGDIVDLLKHLPK